NIISDTSGPANPVITINSGDTVSYSLTVNLNLSAVNATQMIISETGTFSDTDWQPYTTSCSFTFTPGNGLRYLYAKFKNASDTESAITFDDIYLEVAGEDSGPTYISDKILLYDKTWTAKGSPYIITENYLIPSGVKLTIEPGAEIRFDTNVELVIDGALWSVGIADSQILFTANKTIKTKGHWKWIKYRNTAIAAQSKISHSKIEYGTQGLIFESVSVAVDNCQIDSHSQYGIYATNYSGSIDTSIIQFTTTNQGIYINGGSPKIRNNIIKNNGSHGIYLYQCPNFVILNDTIQNNANIGILIQSTQTGGLIENCFIENNSSWGIQGSDVSYSNGPISINIRNNIIKNNRYGIYLGAYNSSSYYTSGTIENNIIENNNKNNDGMGIQISRGNVIIRNNQINSFKSYGIHTFSHTPIIENNTIDTGTDFGIYINGSAGNIRQNTIQNCGTGLWNSGNSLVRQNTITNCTNAIFNNSTSTIFSFNNIYNVNNLLMTNQSTPNSSIVNAEYNYWGIADANVIRQKTTDYYDDPINYGKIDFSPFYANIISDTSGPANPVITINS
ncbi:MAG TPA: right-handed parallel beta-helix repeat-containing protein, partial [bacterium]|nr:right-handed parallel beta-helix repeat-containing protein [bacterium]